MPLRITIEVKGERQLVAVFDAFDRKVRDEVAKVLSRNGDKLTNEIKNNASRVGAKATGELIRTISKRTSNEGLSVAVKAARKQWAYVEWGVGPLGARTATNMPKWFKHKTTMKFPPWKSEKQPNMGRALAAWAYAKGANPFNAEWKNFLIAKAIYKKQGKAARPFVQPAIDANMARIANEIRAAVISASEKVAVKRAAGDGVTVDIGRMDYSSSRIPSTPIVVLAGGKGGQ